MKKVEEAKKARENLRLERIKLDAKMKKSQECRISGDCKEEE